MHRKFLWSPFLTPGDLQNQGPDIVGDECWHVGGFQVQGVFLAKETQTAPQLHSLRFLEVQYPTEYDIKWG